MNVTALNRAIGAGHGRGIGGVEPPPDQRVHIERHDHRRHETREKRPCALASEPLAPEGDATMEPDSHQ